MSDQDAGDEASRDEIVDLEAFEAQFKQDDFAGVAEALGLPPDPETLAWLRSLLLPEFRFFVATCPGEKVSREERIDRAKKLRDAAATLDNLLGPGGARSGLPRRFWASGVMTDQFRDTLRVLAREADAQVQRLRSSPPGQGGRPPKSAARQLGVDLIRVFEKLTQKRAKDLEFNEFYRFAAAAFQCLAVSVPGTNSAFPALSALPAALRESWTSVNKS
jgi:hypothetical protein